ncbi:MAG: FMN-binding protein, partial [Clostridia bacterium]|nr:FMN-binding protein [Clostridia bacterium]
MENTEQKVTTETAQVTQDAPQDAAKAPAKKLPAFVILALISLVAALVLGVTNLVTAGPIEEHRMAALQEAYNAVLPAASYDPIAYDTSAFSNVTGIYEAKDESGNVIGYTVTARQQGYAGPVAVNFGLDKNGTIVGTKIGDTDFLETSGIGARALNPEFAEQFAGINAVTGGAFEALSGATFTSNAVLGSTNGALGAVSKTVFQQDSAGVVFGKNTASAAASGDAAELVAGADMKGEAQGFGGTVTVTFTLDDNLAIEGFTVSAPDETEGLGKRATEAAFQDQFNGKTIPVALEDIEVISGATITSSAVVDAINGAQVAPIELKAGDTLKGEAQGFGGTVSITATLADDLSIDSLTVSAPDETEGLGKRATEAAFQDQFKGKTIPVALEDIEVLSGATITSTAVVDAINSAKPMEGASKLTYEVIGSIDEGSLSKASDGTAVVTASDTFSGTLSGSFTFENGQLTEGKILSGQLEQAEEAPFDGLTISGQGFGGDITLYVTLQDNGTIESLKIDTPNETPGLGKLASEDAFTSQFIGKTAPFTLGEGIDAVAGATITSSAAVDLLNELLSDGTKSAPAAEAAASDELTAKAEGFGGDVVVHVTLNDDGSIKTLSVETAGETDGFGKRASEEEFTSQFIGKSAPFTYGEGVDALSGATITSNAVLEALNSLLPTAEEAAVEAAAIEPTEELTAKAEGFGGDVVVHVTLNDDGSIKTLAIETSGETDGFGKRASEEEFTSQFIGKTVPFTYGEGVDALSGATITSNAVLEALNGLLPAAEEAAVEETASEPAEELTAKAEGFGGDVVVHVTLNDDGSIKTFA